MEISSAQRRIPGFSRQYQVEFSVGDTSRLTKKAKEMKARTRWDNTFFL
jgi:hypothetical protein